MWQKFWPSCFNSVCVCLQCLLSKGPLKLDFLDIYLTTYFGVRNSGTASARRVIFFWKCSNFNLNLKNAEKSLEKVFCFLDRSIWICYVELSALTRLYLPSAVNMSTKSPKILHITKRDFIYLNQFHSDP